MNIGKGIKHARNSKGISQLGLGLAIGNDSSYISRIENNQTEPSLKTILRIATALEVDPLELLEKIIREN